MTALHAATSLVIIVALAGGSAPAVADAQTQAIRPEATTRPEASAERAPDYLIGPEDVLGVIFWRDKDMSAEVTVRPDGKISLPLLNDVDAAGLTPAQLCDRVTERAKRYVEDPSVSVVVKQINSRRVFVTGEVMKPGPYMLIGPMTVLQMIATAGGLREYADSKHIIVMRVEGGRPVSYPFNYQDVSRRKNLRQNLDLKPGDTVVVP